MRGELPPCLPAGRDAVKLILRDGICYAEPADTTGVRGLCSVRVKMSCPGTKWNKLGTN
jgi:hypothetical protein